MKAAVCSAYLLSMVLLETLNQNSEQLMNKPRK
jgi:hypothetical protein